MSPETRRRYKVFIVDDSRFVRKIITMLLERTDEFEVIGSAVDGVEGLSRIREMAPDVVTVDLDMPGLNGLEMLQLLRQTSDVPAILVTAMPVLTTVQMRELNRLGVTEIVHKTLSRIPTDLVLFTEELVSKLRHVCEVNLAEKAAKAN